MLQLNHVTIFDGKREILSDCTFQFQEGKVYIIVSRPEDYVAFFKCVGREKNTSTGEIITWDGSDIYNSSDLQFLPEMLTGNEYIQNALKCAGSDIDAEHIALRAGLDKKDLRAPITLASDEKKSAYRLVPVLINKPYITLFSAPFPASEILTDILNEDLENKLVVLGTSDKALAKNIAAMSVDSELITFSDGQIITLS